MFNNFSLHSCLNIARDKLHTSSSSNSREDVRLCRWVLLKNSISSSMSRAIPERSPSPAGHTIHDKQTPSDDAEVFVFPDGDIFAESFVSDAEDDCPPIVNTTDPASEAQWLDSLLESLADDDDDGVFEHDPDDELISLSDISARSIDASSSQVAPETVFLPPSPPLCPVQYPLYRYRAPRLHIDHLPPLPDDDIERLSLPDAEDSASDTDTESISTPESRSMSSLNDGSPRGPVVRIVDEMMHGPALPPFSFFTLPGFSNNEFTQEC